MTGMAVLGWIAIVVLLPLALAESVELAPWLAKRVLRWGSRRLGNPQTAERYEEEWLADLEHVPGKLTKVGWACGVVICGVPRLRIQARRRAMDQTSNLYVLGRLGIGGRRIRPFMEMSGGLAELHGRVVELASTAGLTRAPICVINPNSAQYQARVRFRFGRRRPLLVLDAGLVSRYRTNPQLADISLGHMFAHLRNNDHVSTYIAVVGWRVFAVLVPTGFLAALATSGASALPSFADIMTLATLAVFTRCSALAAFRCVEIHADATAALWEKPAFRAVDLFSSSVSASRSTPTIHRLLRLGKAHPTYQRRVAALQNPRRLHHAEGLALLGIVVSCVVALAALAPAVGIVAWPALPLIGSGGRLLPTVLTTLTPTAVLIVILLATCHVLVRAASGVECLITGHSHAARGLVLLGRVTWLVSAGIGILPVLIVLSRW